jgi:hypothetical protein
MVDAEDGKRAIFQVQLEPELLLKRVRQRKRTVGSVVPVDAFGSKRAQGRRLIPLKFTLKS